VSELLRLEVILDRWVVYMVYNDRALQVERTIRSPSVVLSGKHRGGCLQASPELGCKMVADEIPIIRSTKKKQL